VEAERIGIIIFIVLVIVVIGYKAIGEAPRVGGNLETQYLLDEMCKQYGGTPWGYAEEAQYGRGEFTVKCGGQVEAWNATFNISKFNMT
jgi:hypothetical protein